MIQKIIDRYRFARFMSARDKDPALEFVMEVDGHRLYKYRALGWMPEFREIVTRVAYSKMEAGIRRDDLTVYCQMVDDLINAGNVAKIAQLNGFLKQQIADVVVERIAYEIGGYSVLVDDEPHEKTTERHNATKAALADKYSTVRDFFLSESVGLMANLNSSIEASLMTEHLKNRHRMTRERTFLDLMGLDMFQNAWTVATPPPSGWQKAVASLLLRKS